MSAVCCARTPAPTARPMVARTPTAMNVLFPREIIFSTPSVIARTDAGTSPAVSTPPARMHLAHWVVDLIHVAGIAARAAFGAMPRRRSPPKRQAAAVQAMAEPLAAPREAAPDCPYRAPQVLRRFRVGPALQVAEHDRHTVTVGKTVNLLMEDRDQFACTVNVLTVPRPFGSPPFVDPPPLSLNSGPHRGAAGDPVQPGPQRVAHPERVPLADQDEEGRLKCVVSFVLILEDAAAGVEHHQPVSLDERGERRLGRVAGRVANRSSSCPSVRTAVTPTLKSVWRCSREVSPGSRATRLVPWPSSALPPSKAARESKSSVF